MLMAVWFSQLKLFKDIAQHRSVSKGAAMNGISQSAASQQILEIEKLLDVKLFDRSTRPLVLTPAGKLHYDFCRDVLRRKEEFDVALEALHQQVEGTVRLASIYSIGLSEMWRLEEEFTRRFPFARVRADYMRPQRVYEVVAADEADLGLVSYPEATKEIAVIPWREEEMVVACAPTHHLARQDEIHPKLLQGVDFIGFDEDLPIRREIDRFLREHDVRVNYIMSFDNLQVMKEAIALGAAVSIAPERVLRAEIELGKLVAIPLEPPGLSRPLGILQRRKKQQSRAVRAFLDLLQESPKRGQ